MSEITAMLGLCKKAGRLSAGFEAAKASIMEKSAKVVFAASDLSAKTYKELCFYAKGQIPVRRLAEDIDEISGSIGQRAGCVSVNDEGFAEKMLLMTGGKCL